MGRWKQDQISLSLYWLYHGAFICHNLDTPKIQLLWLKDLRVDQWMEPCIGLIQENLIESFVQDSLSYILKPHGLC